MSNVVKNHKYNNQSNNNITRVGQQQSINPRGSTPVENHSRHEHRLTYSNAARQGIPQTHESVIHSKSHPSGNQVVQQVVLSQQTNLTQVSNVNPSGPPMPAPTGPNSGSNQLSVLQPSVPQAMSQPGQRYQLQNYHQRPGGRTLLQHTHRPQNAVSSSSGGVVQAVQQNVGPNSLTHPQHAPHYYIMQTQQMPPIQPQIINTHVNNISHFTHQNRGMAQQMPPYLYPAFNQQYGQQQYSYMYAQPYHTQHQPSQLIPQQLHPQRPVSNPVITAPLQVPGPAIGNNDVNETPQMQPKVYSKRARQCATITDPNSGENLDIVELASKDVSKNQTVVPATNESHSGASNLSNTLSTSTPKTNANVDIGLQFAKQVVQKVTENIPHIDETAVSSASNDRSILESEQLVANNETTLSELSEQNDNISSDDNSEQDLTDNKTLVNNINSPISASISSNFNTENDSKQLNNTSAQNLDENNSQNSVEITSEQEIQQNIDDVTDCSENQLLPENDDDLAKDHSIQKVNNYNQRRKDSIKKEDNKILNEELEETNVEIFSDISQNSDVLETIESQITTTDTSSVTISSITQKIETIALNEKVCNNICENENEFHEKEEENIGFNDIKQIETSDDDNVVNSDETIPISNAISGLPYATDQWSPSNPEGKKHYDRDFLMAVRNKTESCKKPESLNEVLLSDIIRKPHQDSSGSGLVSDDPFLPGYASNKGDIRNRFMQRPMNSRQSQQSQRGGHSEKQRKIISTSLTQDVKLHTTDNAWKPSQKSMAPTDEEQETLDLLKKIRGILNKLTPQKYDDLVKQIMTYKVDTEDRLKRVLDLVFEKAVDEPSFCLQYANLCKHLSQFKVINDKEEEVKFQKLLLSKCQKEFEADVYAGIEDLEERRKEVDECTDLAKKKVIFELLDEDKRRARKRSLGNIKLIGELYKLNMLRAMIMVQCIENLLKELDDESLECLCALLKTIGEQLELETTKNPKVQSFIDKYFSTMDEIANQQIPDLKSSARVRFMLRDVIDMRKNGWKARRDENLPKMIDEIHQEAKREDQQKAQDLHTYQKKQEANMDRNKRGGRQTTDQNPDQWTTVSARKSQTMQSQNQSMDWNKLRVQVQMGQNSETIQLGPQTGVWSAGSRGGAQTSQTRYSEEKQVNRFSPLDSGMNDNRKSQKSNSIPSRDSSRGRSNQQHLYQQSGGGRRSQGRGEREDAINLARNFHKPPPDSSMYSNVMPRNDSRGGSRENSAPNSRNSSLRREIPTPDRELNAGNQLNGTNISQQDLEHKALSSIKEYVVEKRITEVIIDIRRLCNESNVHTYISSAINYALEMTSQNEQFAIGKLLCQLINDNIVSIQHFYTGLSTILEVADELLLDIPKFWDYIGDVLAPIFVEIAPKERKQFLLESSKILKSSETKAIMIVKVVQAIARFTSEVKANEFWFNSNLKWEEFLGPDIDVKKYVNQNNVNFTLIGPKFDKMDEEMLQRFSNELIDFVKHRKSNDEIQAFISKYFKSSQTSEIGFTSALFSAVIRGCLIPPAPLSGSFTYTIDGTALQVITPLLVKFFGGDPDVELQALNVLQDLVTQLEHPPNLLKEIFELLYDNSVISHDAFLQWGKHDDKNTAKAVAVASVMRFFTWLQENDDDDEEEVANS